MKWPVKKDTVKKKLLAVQFGDQWVSWRSQGLSVAWRYLGFGLQEERLTWLARYISQRPSVSSALKSKQCHWMFARGGKEEPEVTLNVCSAGDVAVWELSHLGLSSLHLTSSSLHHFLLYFVLWNCYLCTFSFCCPLFFCFPSSNASINLI